MKVTFGQIFVRHLVNFPKSDQLKINAFVEHVKAHGLTNLHGRNKNSDNVPTDDPNWLTKVRYAQAHKLWHYHIGMPSYETATNGEQVSEYILHYQRFDDEICIVAMTSHPPFELPATEYLTMQGDNITAIN